MSTLPEGVHLDLDPTVRTFRDGSVLTGGFPGRLLALSDGGTRALVRLVGDGPLSEEDRSLGGRLVAGGLAHPRLADPAGGEGAPWRVTVVVPVRDRHLELDRCLASLDDGSPVLVVDDGSADPAAVAAVCDRRGARLLRLDRNVGPGAARNHALGAVDTDLVALLDSDCTVTGGWLSALVPLFDDVGLGAVAPRVRPRRRGPLRTVLARFAEARSPLDMGPERGEVGPGRKVSYVPTAALVARRAALAGGFDPDLSVGEDVDLVWRMDQAGWRVRFEPSVSVRHDEPTTWLAWVRRRFRYGTSAGPLARRHPGRLAPVELRAWPSAIAASVIAGRPKTAGALLSTSVALTFRTVRGHGIPLRMSLRWCAAGAGWTLVGLGRALTILAAPALLLAVAGTRRWSRAGTLLLLAPPLVEWWRRRPALDPLRWSLCCIVDDVAYGAGVWAGSLRSHDAGALVPKLRVRQWADTRDRPPDGTSRPGPDPARSG